MHAIFLALQSSSNHGLCFRLRSWPSVEALWIADVASAAAKSTSPFLALASASPTAGSLASAVSSIFRFSACFLRLSVGIWMVQVVATTECGLSGVARIFSDSSDSGTLEKIRSIALDPLLPWKV